MEQGGHSTPAFRSCNIELSLFRGNFLEIYLVFCDESKKLGNVDFDLKFDLGGWWGGFQIKIRVTDFRLPVYMLSN